MSIPQCTCLRRNVATVRKEIVVAVINLNSFVTFRRIFKSFNNRVKIIYSNKLNLGNGVSNVISLVMSLIVIHF